MMWRSLAVAVAIVSFAGCQTVGGYYDRLLGRAQPAAQKPAELPAFSPTAEARVNWQASVGSAGRYAFAPLVVGGAVYAASASGEVTKVELASGKVEWRANVGTGLSSGPGSDGRVVVVGTSRGEVITLDDAGRPAWKVQLTGEVLSTPVVEEGIAVVKTGDGRIYGLASQDGRRRWVYQRTLPALTIRSPDGLTVSRGGVFAGFPGGRLVALIMTSGALAWEATVSNPRGATELERVSDIVGAPLVDGQVVCAVAYQGRMGCFDALKGSQLWVRDMSSVMPIVTDGRSLFITDDKSSVHALDRATGASIWKQDRLAGRSVTGAAVVGDHIALGDYQGYVHLLSRTDGGFTARVATDGSAIRLSPAAVRGSILVQTANGGLFSVSVR
jgi:outer membrane protein assembly factor BamB